MGVPFTKLFNGLTSTKEEIGLLMVGLDSSGKTTILYKLKLGETVTTYATIGVHFETLEYKNVRYNVYDAGGQNAKLPLLRIYFHHVGALIYVVDSNDCDCVGGLDRILQARDYLKMLLDEDGLRDVPLLVMANKQDLPNAMDAAEITEKLGLHSLLHQRPWHVQSTCAISGEGLHKGLDWISGYATNKKVER